MGANGRRSTGFSVLEHSCEVPKSVVTQNNGAQLFGHDRKHRFSCRAFLFYKNIFLASLPSFLQPCATLPLCCHAYSYRSKLEPLAGVRGKRVLGYNTGRAVVSLEALNTTSNNIAKRTTFYEFLSEWTWKQGSLSLTQQQVDVRLARITLGNKLQPGAEVGARAFFDDVCVRFTYFKYGEHMICDVFLLV